VKSDSAFFSSVSFFTETVMQTFGILTLLQSKLVEFNKCFTISEIQRDVDGRMAYCSAPASHVSAFIMKHNMMG